ncbi:MAG: TonB-dependent receptor [Bacteriovorax sp.]|nr:TonB-dependent receptor [Rhizobacter sp.]
MPLSLTLAWPLCARGQAAAVSASTVLAPVVVTATRTEAAAFDVPASIDRVDVAGQREGKAQINISEVLGGVPGLLARDRQNYAQDVQISVRGFGARSTFGVRGVRMYVDGIPATLPDGQGQITNVDLGTAERIEVLRGPFSALYGNSSGGVIQVFTEEGRGPPTLSFGAVGGSDGLLRLSSQLSGSSGTMGYVLGVSHFTTDGYRDHSAAERNIGNAKLTLRPDDASTLTLIANSVALPEALDPLGLTQAQFDANPRGVDPSALDYNTRKSVNQSQAGAIYERRIDAANAVRLMFYAGHRGTEQFQSIPKSSQGGPLSPGGVIDLGRDYRGTDLRWTWKTALADRPFTLVAGAAYDGLDEQRRGYQNFIVSGPTTTLGVMGALRRDENNTVSNFDQYLQASWQFAPQWTLNAGLRHSNVRFDSVDHYIVGTNPNDSGSANYGATLPVLGLMFALDPNVHLYATAGRGFETPTLNELAYRPNGATGLNFGLRAAHSDNVEVGVKARAECLGEASAALFQTRTNDEIVTQTNSGGRSTFQNAGATRRSGIELAWNGSWREHLRAQAALTWLDASYRDSFTTCIAAPCSTPAQQVAVPGGNLIPGVARSALTLALAWAPPQGWRGGIEARALSRVYANDLNTYAAAGHAMASANLGYLARFGNWSMSGFARADNIFDRRYAGSLIVNEGNLRFFEPAPGRTWLAGVSGSVSF